MFFFFFFYCSGFCRTLKWISHGFTRVPHPDPPSHLPLHPIPLGLPSAPGPSACLMHPTWAGDLLVWGKPEQRMLRWAHFWHPKDSVRALGIWDWKDETQVLGVEWRKRSGKMAKTNFQLWNVVGQFFFYNEGL